MQLKNFFLVATVVGSVSAQAASSRGDVQVERSDNNAEGKIEGFEVVRRSVITNTPCRRCVRNCEQQFPSRPTGRHRSEGYQRCWQKCQDNECKRG